MRSPTLHTPAVYAALAETRNLAADDALATALPELEPEYRGSAMSVLLGRGNETALALLVAGYNTCDDDLRQRMRDNVKQLSAGLRIAMLAHETDDRLSAIALIRDTCDLKSAYLLADAVAHACPKTAQGAAEAILAISDQVTCLDPADGSTGPPHSGQNLRYFVNALRRAMSSWAIHFRTEVIIAAARLSEYLEDTIVQLAADPRTKLDRAFDGLLVGVQDPRLSGLAYRALRAASLRQSAIAAFAGAHDQRFRDALLGHAWLLADDQIHKPAARIRGLGSIVEVAADPSKFDARTVRGAVRLVAASGVNPEQKAALLSDLAFGGHPVAGRSAFWTACDQRIAGSEQILRAAAARDDTSVSLFARLELRRRDPRATLVDRNLPKLPESVLELMPESKSTPQDAFEHFWSEFDNLEADVRRDVGHAVRGCFADFDRWVRLRLASTTLTDRQKAVRMIRALDLAAAFEEQVYELARDTDAVVRSMMMELLAALDTPTARRILREAFDDPDERVQANAIEALETIEVDNKTDKLASKLDADNSRVRANAVKALLRMRVREAAVELMRMLASESGGDRLSAVWVVNELKLANVVGRLGEMALRDPDRRVREKASESLKQIDPNDLLAATYTADGDTDP